MRDDRTSRSARMMAGVAVCPVCGQRLGSTEAACSECGAILALRMPDVARRRLAPSVTPHVDVARRRLAEAVSPHVDRLSVRARSIVTAALTMLARRRRTGLAVAALVITLATVAVLMAAVFSPRNISVRPTAPSRPVALALAATAIGAIVGTVAVVSRRRGALRLAWLVNGGAVVAAFCFGLGVALLVVAALERQRMFASAVPTAGDGQSAGAWRREASTLKEARTVVDARLSSESTHPAGDKATRPESVRSRYPAERDDARGVPTIATPASDDVAVRPSMADTATKVPMADILRPPRVAATGLGERVWGDIVRDWERVKRTARDLVRLD